MLNQIRPALVLLLALTALTGLAYPLAMTGLAGALFPRQAGGSIILGGEGQPIGSELIGQAFVTERYFRGRLSATTGPDPADASKSVPTPYNAANSGGSNLGPTNATLVARVKDDAAALKAENAGAPVPLDLLTASASGLDPHISPEAALFQAPRIAKARGLSEARIRALVTERVEGRTLGLFGEARVNVLALNRALDSVR